VFRMQHRVVDLQYDGELRARLGSTDFPASLVTQTGIRFCPWCGRDLIKFYSKTITEVISRQPGGLLLS
jgi:hypothetical protein